MSCDDACADCPFACHAELDDPEEGLREELQP